MLEERGATCATLAAKISRLSASIEFYAMAAKPEELPHLKIVKGMLKNWRSIYSIGYKTSLRHHPH